MKSLKMLIIILIIFVVGLICTLCVLYIENVKNNSEKNNNISIVNTEIIEEKNDEYNNVNEIDDETIIEENPRLSFDTSITDVTDNITMNSLNKAINSYFNYIKDNNTQAINELGENSSYVITNNVRYYLKQAKHTENRYQEIYYTYGKLTIANGNYTSTEQDVYMTVYIDIAKKTYKVETNTSELMNNLHDLNQDEIINLPKGTYNSFEYENINDVQQMEIYLEDFIFQVFNNTEKSYELLNEEYRNKRFGNINKFVEFINNKINQLQNIKIMQNNIRESDGDKIYIGTDENGNYYYVREKAFMDYELMLDNYTLDDFSNLNKEEKETKCIERFVSMINSADYTNAYNLLDETFKSTNFPTEQDFINYLKNSWFSRNIIASKQLTEDGNYVVNIQEKISTTSNSMEKIFKVTLVDETNFTIEFNV